MDYATLPKTHVHMRQQKFSIFPDGKRLKIKFPKEPPTITRERQ